MMLALSATAGLAHADSVTSSGAVRVPQPGSYCALPAPGEAPACLEPARANHGDFFAGVERGDLDDASAYALERELLEVPGSPDAYLALSSLAYGYLRLAREAALQPSASPVLVLRLNRWNELLATSYAEDAVPEHFRRALREAAEDIHANAAGYGVSCTTQGRRRGAEECSAELLERLETVEMGAPLRSPLRRLLDRIRGRGGDDE